MSATIEKIGEFDSPTLTLDMVKANIPDIESVVVSVISPNGQVTYWSKMKSSEMAYHLYGIQADLMDDLKDRE